ncbi:MAG: prepilin-type N-terminal cleavage/methylation domain-containing protein [Candidatus Levybacteria bacterium]|nr:prepilin-type N-terminal cleavage/methylation domain-containing protein [Candidatus Levybacteria bacterium]
MTTILNFKFQISNSKRGFTLIELLIVVSIIGVLATLLMTNFIGIRQRARDAQRKGDLKQIQSSLELYRADQGSYPASPLAACGVSKLEGGNPPVTYMQKIPCDPLNVAPYAYTYLLNGDGTYSIHSCLENVSDSQKDAVNSSPCDGTNNWSFTVQNP